jgi:hypothetical protein
MNQWLSRKLLVTKIYKVLQELLILRQDWYRSAGAVNSATTELTAELAEWLWSREKSPFSFQITNQTH